MIIKLKKLLIVQQIIHVSTLGNVYRIVFENLHTDIRVYSAVRKIFTTRTRFLENRLVNWFEGYITQGINKGINHEDVVSDV